jgi:phospholipid-binding lipoprotein MlaA
MFVFNDKLYAYVIEPVSKGYSFFVPEAARKSVKRFFINLNTPTRFLNCLLQGKMKGAGNELSRLVVNSSIGIGGLFDPAKNHFNLTRYDEDTGQTIGFHGIGAGPYIVLPFLGPSSVRGTVGLVIDMLPLDPLFYAKIKLWESTAIRTYEIVNDSSLRIGEFESLKKAAIDPYISFRDLYFQYVESAIKK